jgi:hypothetical protein
LWAHTKSFSIADVLPNGQPPRFAKKSPSSSGYASRWDTWSEYRFFKVEIDYDKMRDMISLIRNTYPAVMSQSTANPEDWGLVLISGLLEAFPAALPQCVKGASNPECKNIVMATAFKDVEAFEEVDLLPKSAKSLSSESIPPLKQRKLNSLRSVIGR